MSEPTYKFTEQKIGNTNDRWYFRRSRDGRAWQWNPEAKKWQRLEAMDLPASQRRCGADRASPVSDSAPRK